MARRDSWRFSLPSCISMMHPAILEQWSDTRSKSVSISDQTNPASMLHCSFCSRRMWLVRSCSFSPSITCSRGSTMTADCRSFFKNASRDNERISLTALVSTFNSASAGADSSIFFCCSSSEECTRFTAWSAIRSKSPMIFSRRAASLLSSALMLRVLSFTR